MKKLCFEPRTLGFTTTCTNSMDVHVVVQTGILVKFSAKITLHPYRDVLNIE